MLTNKHSRVVPFLNKKSALNFQCGSSFLPLHYTKNTFAGQTVFGTLYAMSRIFIFLGVLYIALAAGGWWLFSDIVRANATSQTALISAQNELAAKEAELVILESENAALKQKIANVQPYASFLSVALCPTLESADKSALCMADGAEWLSQTIQTGSAVSDPAIRSEMSALMQSIGTKKQPSSKQFYEILKPLETRALKMIVEALN